MWDSGRRSAATTKSPPTLIRLVDLVPHEVFVGHPAAVGIDAHELHRGRRWRLRIRGSPGRDRRKRKRDDALYSSAIRGTMGHQQESNAGGRGRKRQLRPPEVAFCHPAPDGIVKPVRDRQYLAAYPAQGVHSTSLRAMSRAALNCGAVRRFGGDGLSGDRPIRA